MKTAQQVVRSLREESKAAQRNPRELFGYANFGPTFPRLNRAKGGIQPKEYGVLASQPKTGKSMLVTQVLPSLAMQALEEGLGRTVDVVTLEMTEEAFLRRAAAIMAQIRDPFDIRRGYLSKAEVEAYQGALETLSRLPIRFLAPATSLTEEQALMYGNSTIGIKEVRSFVTKNTFIWFLDHIGLLSDLATSDLRLGLVKLYKELQYLAKTTASGIVITHLNRTANGKLPNISQLSESSEGGKAADCIYLLSRPFSEKRDELTEAQAASLKMGEPAYLLIASRDGVSDLFPLWWNAQGAFFTELPEGAPIKLPGEDKKKKK